jgi:hypothetical protein
VIRCPAMLDARPLRATVSSIIHSPSLDAAKDALLGAFDRGVLAGELLNEISLQIDSVRLPRFIETASKYVLEPHDWIGVFLILKNIFG